MNNSSALDSSSYEITGLTIHKSNPRNVFTVNETLNYPVRSLKVHKSLLQSKILQVSNRQRGNCLLRFIRNVPYDFIDMIPDYIMGPGCCALFLSLKYHSLYPDYIYERVTALKTYFDSRILLCLVDIDNCVATLLFLNKFAVINNLTLILAWSNEEAARYLETTKYFYGKDASSIRKKDQNDFIDQVCDILSSIHTINRTDSTQLMTQFGSLKDLILASMDELSLCPGIGEKKVRRLYEAFYKPFMDENSTTT